MNRELAYDFLYDPKKFQERFQRVLNRTPKDHAPGNVVFWIAFFRSMASSIQNTQLGKELNINGVCFSIGSVPNSNTKILKLAFKIGTNTKVDENEVYKVILRSISIGVQDGIPAAIFYSENEIKVFEDRIFGKAARTRPATTINLQKVDSQMLHINIKDAKIQVENDNEHGQGSSGSGAKNIKLVRPLQLGKDEQVQYKTLDTMLDFISNPATAREESIEAFFSDLVRLYNNNNDPEFDVSGDLEAAAHGFTYGLFTLIYKDKYSLDTYVEQSAGKGFLDIETIFRKMYDTNQKGIIKTNAGSRIIGEFKRGNEQDTSAQAGIDQIKDKGYNYNLYGRTNNENLIAVGLNFNRGITRERVKVDLSLRAQSTDSFISNMVELDQSIDKPNVESLLGNIYHSIRTEEPLHLVTLGDLLSQSRISNKKVFTIDSKELLSNTKVTIFSFQHNSKHAILTITDTPQKIEDLYFKEDPQTKVRELARTRSKTRNQNQNDPPPVETTIEKELDSVVTQIQQKEGMHTGKRIDLTINSNEDRFTSYMQDIKVEDIRDRTNMHLETATKYTAYDCDIDIATDGLLDALMDLPDQDINIDRNPLLGESMDLPDQEENKNASIDPYLVNFKKLLFKIKDLIAPYREAGFKSLMHGLYLTKFQLEASLGRGRVDGIIRDNSNRLIPLEFKFNRGNQKDIEHAQKQLQEYIKHLKSFTDAREVKGLVLNFNTQAESEDAIIQYGPVTKSVDHFTSDEQGNSLVEPRITGEDTNVEETLSEVQLSKTTGARRDLKREIDNLQDVKDRGRNVGLKKMKGLDGAGCSWMERRKRNVESCINEEASDDFLYEPLEKDIAATKEQIKAAKLYAQVAMMLSLDGNMGEANGALDNILTYNRNVGEIVNEGAENHSTRELKLLQDHYKAAYAFVVRYHTLNYGNGLNNQLLEAHSQKADHHNSWLVDNGSHSLLVISDKDRYKLYSPDFNYRYLFQTKEGTTFSEVMGLVKAFLKWRSGSTKHKIYILSRDENLLHDAAAFLKADPILANPDKFLSDQACLSRYYHNAIEGISMQTISALFSIDDKPVDISMLTSFFFRDYGHQIRFRVQALHKILPSLTEQEKITLAVILKRYNIYADTSYLDKLSIDERPILEDYTNQVMRDFLKEKGNITPEQLSEISWNTIGKELEKYQDISFREKEKVLENSKLIHKSVFKNIWATGKGIATQALFFLPDMIRAANTGNADSLVQNIEMLGGDAALNELYTKLIQGLESVGSVGAASLLRKIPVTSPIFKTVVICSVVELHQQLATLPYDSEERDIITHQLGEQYVTLGLMVAELFGAETGPLWAALILEQVMYGGEAFRKSHHLHIDLGEAILMSLGFEHDKYEDIMEDRRLVSLNLAIMNSTENALKMQFGWKIVKVPVLGRTEWNRVNEDQIPEYVKNKAIAQENRDRLVMQIINPNADRCQSEVEISIGAYIKYIRYNVGTLDQGTKLRATRCKQTRTPNNDYWKRMNYYVIQEDTKIQFAPYDSASCNEVNIFQSETSEKDFQHKLVQPVEDDAYCEKKSPSGLLGVNSHSPRGLSPELKYIKIQGGLAAVYVNTKTPLDNTAQRTIHVVFDPREGNLELDLDDLGSVINELNRQHRPAPSLSNIDKYTFVTHITHKLYPSLIIFPESASNKFSLQASSNTIISKYYIDVTIPFQIQDKSAITKFVFLSPIDHNTHSTIGEEKSLISQTIHKMYINGPDIRKYDITYAKYFRTIVNGENVERVASISDSSIILEGNREYLELVLDNIVIKHLRLSAKHVRVSGVQGKNNSRTLTLSKDVETFNLTIAGGIIIFKRNTRLCVIANDKAIKPVLHYSGQLYMDTFLYKLQVANLHPVLDSIISTSLVAKFNIMESIDCNWNSGNFSNILSIESSQDSKYYFLLLGSDNASLKVLDDNNQLIRIEVKHYSSKGSLDDGLILENNGNFTLFNNASLFNLNKYQGALASLIFQSDQKYKVLHHFPYEEDSITINNIDYTIREGRMYVVVKGGEIDANQLIKYRESNGNNAIVVPIFTNTPPKDTNISFTEDKLHINNGIFQNLPDDVQLHFKGIKHGFSIKELKDTLSSQLDLGDSDHHRNRRAVDVDAEPMPSSPIRDPSLNRLSDIRSGIRQGKIVHKKEPEDLSIKEPPNSDFNTISSGSNRLAFWPTSFIKKAGEKVLSIFSNNWLSGSKEEVQAHLPVSNLPQREPLVGQPLAKAREASERLLEADLDPVLHQQPHFNASPTGPTLLEMGDQWVANMDVNGLLTWGTLLARKWTGYRPKAAKLQSYNLAMDIKLSIQSHELVDAFMDKVQKQSKACSMEEATSAILDNPKLYTQAVETVGKKLATGELNTITQDLFEQLVQQNISKVASKSSPDQANQLLTSVREDLPQFEKKFLQQETSVEAESSEEMLASVTPKADINLLKQAMCSIGPIDQLSDTASLLGNTYSMKNSLVQNSLNYDNSYTECVGL